MYHYLYKTTNLLDGMFYVGKHSNEKENDIYYGSGTRIKRALEKYGKENFKKEIISRHDSEDDAFYAETLIVTEEFVARPDTYNLKVGGRGGSWGPTGRKASEETRKRMSISATGGLASKETKILMSVTVKQFIKDNPEELTRLQSLFLGRTHTKETRKQIGISVSKALKGVKQRIVTCPHCGLTGGVSNMKRWHFDNCKSYQI